MEVILSNFYCFCSYLDDQFDTFESCCMSNVDDDYRHMRSV